jgi:hypothetical protein
MEEHMKSITKSARVETAYGNAIDPIDFTYSYEKLEKGDSIPADEKPSDEDLLTYVNQTRNAAARSKAQAKALDAADIKKPTLEDPAVRLATMIKVLVAAGNSREQSEQIAKSALGL